MQKKNQHFKIEFNKKKKGYICLLKIENPQ